MLRNKENKWTRERGFLEVHGGDLLMLAVALFFLALTIAGFAIILFQPRIPGLSDLFAAPPPPPPAEQKLHLAPGETEMKLYDVPAKKPGQPKK